MVYFNATLDLNFSHWAMPVTVLITGAAGFRNYKGEPDNYGVKSDGDYQKIIHIIQYVLTCFITGIGLPMTPLTIYAFYSRVGIYCVYHVCVTHSVHL